MAWAPHQPASVIRPARSTEGAEELACLLLVLLWVLWQVACLARPSGPVQQVMLACVGSCDPYSISGGLLALALSPGAFLLSFLQARCHSLYEKGARRGKVIDVWIARKQQCTEDTIFISTADNNTS
jgi:hypothetical protein